MVAGAWDEAVDLFTQGLVQATKLGIVQQQTLFALNLGILYTWQGDDDEAEAHLQQLRALTGNRPLDEHAIYGTYALADLRLRQGQLDEAARLLADAEAMVASQEITWQLAEIYRLWAQVHLAQGNLDAAYDYAQRSVTLAGELAMTRDEGIGQGVLGQVLAAQEQAEAARAAFQRGTELLADEPYELARVQAAWGQVQVTQGLTKAGQAHLDAAQKTFTRLGAPRDLRALSAPISA